MVRSYSFFFPVASVVALIAAAPTVLDAQRAWRVDRKESLAWWQMSPHFASLWGTTCPGDPSWEAGEGGSSDWPPTRVRRRQGFTPEKADTFHVPLYPRLTAEPLCREAVTGHIERPDTSGWSAIHGEVVVAMDSVEMGSTMRDRFAYSTVFQTGRYPTVGYRIDSLMDLSNEGDTLVGTVSGVVTIRGVNLPLPAALQAWPDSGGMRVRAKLRLPAHLLEDDFGVSRIALSLGVGANLWEDLFMGVDLILRPEAPGGN
jgi:hypothetical protein